MAGLGSESKLGIRKETTPGTGVVPTETLPFTSEGFTAPRALVQSNTISGDPMVTNTVPADSESSGSITQEYDGESSGNLIWFATGDNGYTDEGAFTDGFITSAPTGSASGSGASLAAGDYIYKVCAVWTHDILGEKFIMPASTASSAITVTSGQEVGLSWTDPTGLTLADHTYAGTALYRSDTDGLAATCRFFKFVSGTGASYTDDGTDTRDTNVIPVSNTTIYEHTFVGASAATGLDRLDYFSVQISKNVSSDERYTGNKIGELSIEVGGRGEIVTINASMQGNDVETVSGEFAASAPTIRQQTLGRNVRVAINGSSDCDIQSLSWTLNNNINVLPTLCNRTIAEGLRNVTGSMTLLFNDRTLFNKAVNAEEISVDIYMRGEPLVKSGATLSLTSHGVTAIPFPRYTKIAMERVSIGEYTNPVGSPDQIIANMNYQALKGTTSSTDATITLINTIDEYDGA